MRWVIGALVLFLIPIVFPIAMVFAIVYYIPVTIGAWICEFFKALRSIKNEN
jgi:hypothetical protein